MKPKEENEWASLFASALRNKEKKPIGNGWKTADEIAKDMNVSRAVVKNRLTFMGSSGAVEKFNGSKMTPDGHICNMTWWRIKKGKK